MEFNCWIILDEYYPIKANLTADSANPDWFGLLANHKVTITVDGDLVDLNAHALVSGVTDADIQIRSNVLAPHLPFTTDIQVEHARWPVTGDKADYALKKLNLKADGSLKQLALELKTDGVEALNYPELKADIALSTDFHSANISRLEVVSSAGDKVSLKGNTIWSEQYSFDYNKTIAVCKLIASSERSASNLRHTVRDTDRCQTRAAIERFGSDFPDTVRDHE